jgi:hypothetical protein
MVVTRMIYLPGIRVYEARLRSRERLELERERLRLQLDAATRAVSD